MANFVIIVLISIFLLVFNSFGAETKWTSGFIRGHEDINYFAVLEANKLISEDFYPKIYSGESGLFSTNPILQGSYETDFPSFNICTYYKKKECSFSKWHQDPYLQKVHSLRNNFSNLKVQSVLESLKDIREVIYINTINALYFYQKKDFNTFFYLIGHILHTIQDSFSLAHVKRDPITFEILDICTYGKQFKGICYHNFLDKGDYIWNLKSGCFTGRKYECLKDEAQNAVKASIDYLIFIFKNIKEENNFEFSLQEYLNTYFVRRN